MISNVNKAQKLSNAQEAVLLTCVADEDRDAFERLFNAYHPRLFRFIFRLTHSYNSADELTNDVLHTVWQDAGRFRGDSKVSTWIFGIAYRKSVRRLRKRKLTLVPVLDQDAIVDDNDGDIERQDWVQQGIQQLPPKQRLTVMLVYYLGLSCEETATVTGSPVSTVKTRMFHARRKLKTHLAKSASPNFATEDDDHE